VLRIDVDVIEPCGFDFSIARCAALDGLLPTRRGDEHDDWEAFSRRGAGENAGANHHAGATAGPMGASRRGSPAVRIGGAPACPPTSHEAAALRVSIPMRRDFRSLTCRGLGCIRAGEGVGQTRGYPE